MHSVSKEFAIFVKDSLYNSIRNTSPQIPASTGYIMIDGKLVDIRNFPESLRYAVLMVKSEELLLEEKKDVIFKTILRNLDKLPKPALISFLLSLPLFLVLLQLSGYLDLYHYTIEALLEACRRGKISKRLLRLLVRRLLKAELVVDPELIELAMK